MSTCKTILLIFYRVVEILLLLALCLISFFFTKEVWEEFQLEKTSFKQYDVDNSESPTLVICFWPPYKYNPISKTNQTYSQLPNQLKAQFKYFQDFNLTFGVYGSMISRKDNGTVLKEGLNVHNFSATILEEKDDNKNEVKLETMMTLFGNCYKISSNIVTEDWVYVWLKFNSTLNSETIPKAVDVFVTSEYNSHGNVALNYFDGQETVVSRISANTWVKLRSEKYSFLSTEKSIPKCQNHHSFYDCYSSKLYSTNFQSCPKKCSPFTYSGLNVSLCSSKEDFDCATKVAEKIFLDKSRTRCLPMCQRVQYSQTYRWDNAELKLGNNFKFFYQIAKGKMNVYEEYLIYDVKGMVGSIGGTLGLFIGFSFYNVIGYLIGFLRDTTP